MHSTLQNAIVINGVYDFVCSLSILFEMGWFRRVHMDMFRNSREWTRLQSMTFSYFIFTYGVIRLYAYTAPVALICLSYIIEGVYYSSLCMYHENDMYIWKALFTCVFSFILGILSFL